MYSCILALVMTPFAISLLKPYTKLRVLPFFDQDRDPLGAGYQIIQSKKEDSSGGRNGKGYLKGTRIY